MRVGMQTRSETVTSCPLSCAPLCPPLPLNAWCFLSTCYLVGTIHLLTSLKVAQVLQFLLLHLVLTPPPPHQIFLST